MSKFGKFKNADELYEAYLNLEKEFTKKCQDFNELKKSIEPKFNDGEIPYTFTVIGNRIEIIKLSKIRNVVYYKVGKNKLMKYYEFVNPALKMRSEIELFKTEKEARKKLKEIDGKLWRL